MGMPKLSLSSGGMLASGLAQGMAVAADHYGMEDKQRILDESDARRQAALEAKERRMAEYRQGLELSKEEALYQRNQKREDDEQASIAEKIKSFGEEYNSKLDSEPGGYDPKDPQGKNKIRWEDLPTSEQLTRAGAGLLSQGEIKKGAAITELGRRMTPKEKGYTWHQDSVTGAIYAFDQDSGNVELKVPGGKSATIPKNEWEAYMQQAGGDPGKAIQMKLGDEIFKSRSTKEPSDLEKVASARSRIKAGKGTPRDEALVEAYDSKNDSTTVTEKFDENNKPAGKSVTRKGRGETGKSDISTPPEATKVVGGKTYVKVNGEWYESK